MKTLCFKNSDEMPAIGLGTWKSKPEEVYAAVKVALEMGYRHIDCAAIYGNEAEVGRAISEAMDAGIVSRQDLWVTSKLWNNAHRRRDVAKALAQTLKDLRLDYLDLYLIHWPVAIRSDVVFPSKAQDFIRLEEIPPAETWAGMMACRDSGKVRHIGVSNFSRKKLMALADDTGTAPEMNQIELHPFLQQTDMLDYCASAGILLTAYSPLGSGDRPTAMKASDEPSLLADAAVAEIAGRHKATPAQILIAWALARGTAVIPKSVNPGRMRENFEAGDIRLSDEDMAGLADLDRHYRYVKGSFWAVSGSPYTLENLWDE